MVIMFFWFLKERFGIIITANHFYPLAHSELVCDGSLSTRTYLLQYGITVATGYSEREKQSP